MAGLATLENEANGCNNSQWAWHKNTSSLLDPNVRGVALLDPIVAQHTHFVKWPAAITPKEIDAIKNAAEEHKQKYHPDGNYASRGTSDVPGKLYLHYHGVSPEIEPIVSKIEALVRISDRENWGLLRDADCIADGPIAPRCVEFHSYSAADGRERCDDHYDAGSLFTADVMLSEDGDFDGGEMQSTAVDEGGASRVTQHTFLRGDLLVFLSHKAHSVAQLLRGRRMVLVVEYWQGGKCQANHRCCDGGVGRDALCGHAEGDATYYSRYDRPET